MKKNLWKMGAIIFVMALMSLPAWSDGGSCDKDDDPKCKEDKNQPAKNPTSLSNFEQKYQQSFQEIMLLNLINGLNLTEEQIKKLIDQNQKVDKLRKEAEAEMNKLAADVFEAYQKLKETLEKNQGIPKDVEQRAVKMERQIIELREKVEAKLPELEKEAESILSDAQLEIVNTFNPCLIPPKNLKDPVRAGQANDNEMLMNLFQRIRSLSSAAWEKDKNKIATRHLEEMQKHIGRLNEKEYAQEKEKFLTLLEEIREMDDVEFELNAPDLADEYMKHGKKLKGEDLRDEMEQLRKTRRGGFGRVGQYLLNPTVVPILARRLEIMKNTPKQEPVDLDKINPPSKSSKK